MSKVGKIERTTQNRIVQLITNELHNDYLGYWGERDNNSNFEEQQLFK